MDIPKTSSNSNESLNTQLLKFDIPNELGIKLNEAMRHPNFITVTYLDSAGFLQHFFIISAGFHNNDLMPTMDHIRDMLSKHLNMVASPVKQSVESLKQKIRDRKMRAKNIRVLTKRGKK